MSSYSVYVHTAPNGKKYVGITSRNPEYRWNNGKGYSQNKHFHSAIIKYGWENITHEIVVDGVTKETACALEKDLIKKYQSNNRDYGYNNSAGGENPNEGHKADEAELEKRSKTHQGVKMSDKGKENIRNAKKGKPNGREGAIGEKSNNYILVFQIDQTTKKVVATYCGYAEMSRVTGYARTPVMETANGKRKRAYGYLWECRKRGDANVPI